MPDNYLQVITTTEKKDTAEEIAQKVVAKKLAACVQVVGPIISTYWWQNKIEKSEEWLCLIKTKKELYNELESTIIKIHPYEIPEVIALPIVTGNKDYLKWLEDNIDNKK
ncbi:MAG: divalent-cation tolerance protein CutA [Peptococcaceae bacterium]